MSIPVIRSTTAIPASATVPRGRLIALFATVVLTVGLVAPAALPLASANGTACIPAGNLWHFQNYTHSGKNLKLEGYAGENAKGRLMITCDLYIPKGSLLRSRGGEVWIPYDVVSVKVTSWSDGDNKSVLAGPLDNKNNACFRITLNDMADSWLLTLKERGDSCDTNG
jgi:hypothetical protein